MVPRVSIIITTKNEANNIASCLRSIQNQTYKNFECTLVDNNSSDDTKKIAESLGVTVFTKGPERSAQRNFGAACAKGEYLLFLDADMELTPKVVEECMKMIGQLRISDNGSKEAIRNSQSDIKQLAYKALVIPEKSFGIGFWAQCKALERSFYLNVPWIESARFYEKKAYQKIGGYDENLTGPEDFELPQRFKHMYGEECVGRISSFILHNEGNLSLGKTLRKKYYYGKKMKKYQQMQSAKGYFDKQASIFGRYRLFFTKSSIILRSPITFIGMLFLKTLEMVAVMFGAISTK